MESANNTAGNDRENERNWILSSVVVVGLYATIILVHILCPSSKRISGYVCDPQHLLSVPAENSRSGAMEPLQYDLNGFRCFWILMSGFVILCNNNFDSASVTTTVLADHCFECAIISNGIGLLLSFYFVHIRYPKLSSIEQKANNLRRAPTRSPGAGVKNTEKSRQKQRQQSLDWDDRTFPFFFGREFNPRWKISKMGFHKIFYVKMLLYLIGAVVLELNILSAVCWEREYRRNQHTPQALNSSNSNAMILYAGLFTWFVLDYLWYEEVHLYTYDLFAEKIGFKLCWGCLCFYPFFYAIGVLPFIIMMDHHYGQMYDSNQEEVSWLTMVLIAILYLVGSTLTRGANMQKFHFRCHPERSKVSLFGGFMIVKQECVPSSKGRLLCSGFWGLSRHVNYFGEILQAFALALPASLQFWSSSTTTTTTTTMTTFVRWIPWLYPLYYVALFVPRQMDDEALMRQKYGDDVIDEYIQLVPYRMVPGLY